MSVGEWSGWVTRELRRRGKLLEVAAEVYVASGTLGEGLCGYRNPRRGAGTLGEGLHGYRDPRRGPVWLQRASASLPEAVGSGRAFIGGCRRVRWCWAMLSEGVEDMVVATVKTGEYQRRRKRMTARVRVYYALIPCVRSKKPMIIIHQRQKQRYIIQ